MKRALPLVLALLTACGQGLALTHTETKCIKPGEMVTVEITTTPGTLLSTRVQDDFGGDLDTIPPLTVGGDGKATLKWQSPPQLPTTTLHVVVSAANGEQRTSRDIHVVVGGNGRAC
jgi:hypothetical protein